MTSKLTRFLVGAAMGAGAVGVILALAGVYSPVRTALVIVFLIVAPTGAIAGLLRGFDPFARLILAVVSTLAVLSIVAMILLSSGLWSPLGELAGVAVITAGCLAAQVPLVRGRAAAWATPRWRALLRHIPGLRSAAPAREPAPASPAGAAAGNGQAVQYVAEVKVAMGGPADADPADAEVAENGQAAADGTGSATAAESTSATEPTTPLPAIRD